MGSNTKMKTVMRFMACLLFCMLWFCDAQAQDLNRNISNKLIKDKHYLPITSYNNRPDTAAIKYYLIVADSIGARNEDSAVKLMQLCFAQSKQINFAYGMAHSLNTLGNLVLDKGLFDSAIAYFNGALKYLKLAKQDKQLYKAYSNIGIANFNLGKYDKAMEYYLYALSIVGKHNNIVTYRDSFVLYYNIGILWDRMGEATQSMNNLSIAERVAANARDTGLLGNIYLCKGDAAAGKMRYDEATKYYLQALNIAELKEMDNLKGSALNSLGHLNIAAGKSAKALMYARQANDFLAKFPGSYNYDRFHAAHNLGRAYLDLKDYKKAGEYLIPTFNRAMALHFTDLIPHMEPDVAAYYAATHHYQKAYEHIKHYALLKDSLLEQNKSKMLEVWMKSRNSERDKAIIAQRFQILQQKDQLQHKNFLIFGIIAIIALLGILFFFFIRNYRNKQKLQDARLLQVLQEQQINQLKAHVRGEELERNRIAQELHDGIASQLWAIKLNVDSLQRHKDWNDQQRNNLGIIYQQLDDTTQEVRKTAHNLMPDLLLQEGLATALASLCQKVGKQTELEIDFQEYGNIPRLDPEIELTLYRMIQELMQNVLKHATGATQLLVQLSCNDVILNITVEDNGMGLGNKDLNGMGLSFIHKRVRDLYGQMDLQSEQGLGTTVYLEFDIHQLL